MRVRRTSVTVARRIQFDLLEQYLRHTGHADLLREAIDGLVGNDPPRPGDSVNSPDSV